MTVLSLTVALQQHFELLTFAASARGLRFPNFVQVGPIGVYDTSFWSSWAEQSIESIKKFKVLHIKARKYIWNVWPLTWGSMATLILIISFSKCLLNHTLQCVKFSEWDLHGFSGNYTLNLWRLSLRKTKVDKHELQKFFL